MTATIQTIPTPDGPFTLLVDDHARVLASGWSADPAAIVGRIAPAPADIREGDTDAASAVDAYYAGDLTAIDTVAVAQTGTALQLEGWAALRRIAAGHPLTYAEFAAALGRPAAVRVAASICARNAPARLARAGVGRARLTRHGEKTLALREASGIGWRAVAPV